MWNIKKIVSKGDYLYALVPEHPKATKNGYVLLHRIVMENHLGRFLNANEVVHHKNLNKKDNNIKNLEILSIREHAKKHGLKLKKHMVLLKCPCCKKVFSLARNKSFLVKKTKYNCNCCSCSCRGKLTKMIQLQGVTLELEDAISENLLTEYLLNKAEDNSEETFLQGVL